MQRKNKIPPKKSTKIISGIVKRHPDGFGFLIPDSPEEEDIYIPKHSMVGIMTHDKVEVLVIPEPGGSRFRGEIQKVTSRGITSLVGSISDFNEKYMLIVDQSGTWGADLKIPIEFIKSAKSGDLVHIEITQYPSDGVPFLGKVVEVLGNIEDPLNDVKRVLKGLNIPVEFSAATYKEVAPLKENPDESEFKNRKDLRTLDLITIDGATAKDFDDAVFTETTATGFHLIVAIADVSHYVKPGTALDKDAYERGTSVYFPNYVVPMLPEELSNGLCSLKPNVPRLCLVADMNFDFTGQLTNSDFYEAVMLSKARVLYGEAQEIIDGERIPKLEHIKDNILRCADLARVLMGKRFREGSLDLEIPETQLVIDGSGNPIDVQKSDRLFAHRLIEELMLAANVAVSRFLEGRSIPSIYRIHDEPSPDNIMLLERYLHNLGTRFRAKGGVLQKQLTTAIQEFKNRPEEHVVHMLTLRSMAQAKYSSQNIGHFGLGFESYTHFTSPIRRYPDLLIHRLIKSQVCTHRGYPQIDEETLTSASTILSSCEQRAVKSERQFMSIKKARFMTQHIGKEFEGLVSSVAKFGAFVLLREYDIDGLVKLENLGDDKWNFDEDNLCLTGQRSKKIVKIGDTMKIVVLNADPNLGQIDFDIPNEEKAFGRSGQAFNKDKAPRKDFKEKRENTQKPKRFDKPQKKSQKAEVRRPPKEIAFKSNFQNSNIEDEDAQRRRIIEEKLRKLGLDGASSRSTVDSKNQKTSHLKSSEKPQFAGRSKSENSKNRQNNRKNSKKRR